ncbi:MAG: hypothetical protein WAX77_16100 [Methylococcaceae bacterium]
MINYAIIGTPQGFKCEQWNYPPDNTTNAQELAKYIKGQLDIETKLICPSKTAELFLFKTVSLDNGKKLDYFILYRGADEINTSRPGSFYGSAIIVLDRQFISIEAVITALRELADIVKQNCIYNNGFTGLLSKADDTLSATPTSIKKLSELSKQSSNNQALPQANYSAKFYLVDSSQLLAQAASDFYKKIINKYQQVDIYFSASLHDTSLSLNYYPTRQSVPEPDFLKINQPEKPSFPKKKAFQSDNARGIYSISDKPNNETVVANARQKPAQSKHSKDIDLPIIISLIGTGLSLIISVTALVKDYRQGNSGQPNTDAIAITQQINELKTDVFKLKGQFESLPKNELKANKKDAAVVTDDTLKKLISCSIENKHTVNSNVRETILNKLETDNKTSTLCTIQQQNNPNYYAEKLKETLPDKIKINTGDVIELNPESCIFEYKPKKP